MLEIFTSMFNHSLLTLTMSPPRFKTATPNMISQVLTTLFNTLLRAAVIYGFIRVIFTAFSHGSF